VTSVRALGRNNSPTQGNIPRASIRRREQLRYRYGRAQPPNAEERDALLDRFIPRYDVVERHRVVVAAPAAVTLQAAKELFQSALVGGIFKARETVMG
jgi:hypothetical protein